MPKLTKRFIDAIKATGEDAFYWDDELPCFGLRVLPSGYKSFHIQYRNEAGRTRRASIGQYGRLAPDEARTMARQMLADVSRGQDVVQLKADRRKGLTVAELGKRYMAEHAEAKKKPASISRDKQLLKRFIVPAFGKTRIKDVTREDVARFHHDMRKTPIQANRTLALLSKMFNLAERWGLRTDGSNPCRHVERYQEKKRERFLSGDELARLGNALAEAEATEMPSAILALRLILFTGCRVSEILTLQWSYVDFERNVLNLPESKTGRKLVPLPRPALNLLESAPRLHANPYVCPGIRPGGHLVGLHRIWNRIRTKAGLEDLRHHDLRHSYASVAAAANMGLPIIGKLLGHSQPATTARYAHLAIDPLIAASEEIATRIDEAMKKKPKQAKVIALNSQNRK
jgi:integrase